jgi:hypothetical protein
MPEIIIVNTSPLFYFHRLGLLELFQKLYGRIIIPEAVKSVKLFTSAIRNRIIPSSALPNPPSGVSPSSRHPIFRSTTYINTGEYPASDFYQRPADGC